MIRRYFVSLVALLWLADGPAWGQVIGGGGGSGLPVSGGGTVTGPIDMTCSGCTTANAPRGFPDSAAFFTFQTSNSNTFSEVSMDGTGNITRTFDQQSGRMDLYGNSSTSNQGSAFVLAYNNSSSTTFTSGAATTASTTLTFSGAPTNAPVNQTKISGAGIPAGTIVLSYNGATFTMTLNQAASVPINTTLTYNGSNAAVNDELGHYAYRGLDSYGNYDTYAYVIGSITNPSATSLGSALTLGVSSALSAPSGNGQANYDIIYDGNAQTWTEPTGLIHYEYGTRTVSVAGSPTQTYFNTSTLAQLALTINSNVLFAATSASNISFSVSGTTSFQMTNSLATLPLPTQILRDFRTSKTANYTLLTTDAGTEFDNSGASGEVDFTLPTTPALGTKYGFCTRAAQILKVIAGTANFIMVGGTQSASAGSIQTSTNGVCVELEATNTNLWTAKRVTGTGGTTAGTGAWTVT